MGQKRYSKRIQVDSNNNEHNREPCKEGKCRNKVWLSVGTGIQIAGRMGGQDWYLGKGEQQGDNRRKQ